MGTLTPSSPTPKGLSGLADAYAALILLAGGAGSVFGVAIFGQSVYGGLASAGVSKAVLGAGSSRKGTLV